MKIRTKLIVNYSFLSVTLLVLFSLIVVLSYIKYRQNDFLNRLHNRALSTANMYLNEQSIDSSMLRLIDKNIITAMGDLQITIYDNKNVIVYSNLQRIQQLELNHLYSLKSGIIESFLGYKTIVFKHSQEGHIYTIKASAIDNYGIDELKGLIHIIIWVLAISLMFIAGFGFYNAIWSLKPFRKIIKEVENIEPTLIAKRLTITGNDELSQLSHAFNTLLDRIEMAFETEKSFISNASHELRTPVTSVLGQIEVVLNKSRSEEEYKAILQSVYDDTTQMANIINGFLDLAEANLANNHIIMHHVRIDELIFDIVEDFKKRKPNYQIFVDFSSNPEIDTQLECNANKRLLKLMFSNLIDNACKYSGDKKAFVSIDFTQNIVQVSIVDHGIGIPSEDVKNIFKPLYRGSNTSGKAGHGIGLAIVKRIADLHNISIEIKSELNIGTTICARIKL